MDASNGFYGNDSLNQDAPMASANLSTSSVNWMFVGKCILGFTVVSAAVGMTYSIYKRHRKITKGDAEKLLPLFNQLLVKQQDLATSKVSNPALLAEVSALAANTVHAWMKIGKRKHVEIDSELFLLLREGHAALAFAPTGNADYVTVTELVISKLNKAAE
jgi:hypothetical protein